MTSYEMITVGLTGVILLETTYLLVRATIGQPRKKFSKRPVFVDTSVLMDGRIVEVAKTGFISDELVIPRSVILELQLLADKSDHEKRERARYGLDVIAELQAIDGLDVTILRDQKAKDGVDEQLIALARTHRGAVMTIDFNLNKVASTDAITVLNINQLAQTLRMAHLPGEKMSIELVEKGQDSHQAVGYLPDGTMVVVEHAQTKVGQTVVVECIRSLQTVAGKMMFARLLGGKPQQPSKKQQPAKKKPNQNIKSPEKAQVVKPAKTMVAKAKAQTSESRGRSPRPRTSRQRENSLLQTIENQPEE